MSRDAARKAFDPKVAALEYVSRQGGARKHIRAMFRVVFGCLGQQKSLVPDSPRTKRHRKVSLVPTGAQGDWLGPPGIPAKKGKAQLNAERLDRHVQAAGMLVGEIPWVGVASWESNAYQKANQRMMIFPRPERENPHHIIYKLCLVLFYRSALPFAEIKPQLKLRCCSSPDRL